MGETGVFNSEAGQNDFVVLGSTIGRKPGDWVFLMVRSLLKGREDQRSCQEELFRER